MATLEEVEEEVFRASIDVEVSRVGAARHHELRPMSLEETMYELHSWVAELGFLDPNLVTRKLGVNEGREIVRRPQLRQVHRGHVPSQLRDVGKRFKCSLNMKALREGSSYERNKSQQRPHGCG